MKKLMTATLLAMAVSTSAHAAIEIDESQGYGPTYSSAALDITIGKPLQLAGAVLGTALHVVGLPFSMASDSVEESKAVLVDGPWDALRRCTGCTQGYDNYVKSQTEQQGQVRFTVDGPSEIIINSNNEVIVNQ